MSIVYSGNFFTIITIIRSFAMIARCSTHTTSTAVIVTTIQAREARKVFFNQHPATATANRETGSKAMAAATFAALTLMRV